MKAEKPIANRRHKAPLTELTYKEWREASWKQIQGLESALTLSEQRIKELEQEVKHFGQQMEGAKKAVTSLKKDNHLNCKDAKPCSQCIEIGKQQALSSIISEIEKDFGQYTDMTSLGKKEKVFHGISMTPDDWQALKEKWSVKP